MRSWDRGVWTERRQPYAHQVMQQVPTPDRSRAQFYTSRKAERDK